MRSNCSSLRSINPLCVVIAGMHRKSLEAAEALKNDDSGASDREDAQSKASDVSSIENPGGGRPAKPKSHQQSPQPPEKPKGMDSPRRISSPAAIAANHEASPGLGAMAPTSSSAPAVPTHSPPSPSSSLSLAKTAHVSSSPTHQNSQPPTLSSVSLPHHHHLTALDAKRMAPSPPRSNYLLENDSEAFRWVDYNREAISYIRCAITITNQPQSKYLFGVSSFRCRNNSIACLRAKAQEHQARLLNSGLFLQVRSLAGLQNPLNHSPPHPLDSNANSLLVDHHSPREHLAVEAPRSFHQHSAAAVASINSGSVKNEHNPGVNMAF